MTPKALTLLLPLLLVSATSDALNAFAQTPNPVPTTPPDTAFAPIAPGIAIFANRSEEGYALLIDSSSLPVAFIQVDIDDRSLFIHANRQHQRRQYHSSVPGQGQFRSYSYSSRSGHFMRRLPLPPDADPSRAVREDSRQRITIFIPRLTH